MNAWLKSSTVTFCATAIDTAWMSSEARGATTTPPMMMPVVGRQNSFTKPSVKPCILERALEASGSSTDATRTSPVSTCSWVMPTVATSGVVNTFDETRRRSSGVTASPSECHMAILPCMAATEARANTPVTSPAA